MRLAHRAEVQPLSHRQHRPSRSTQSAGCAIDVDDETAKLLDFAATLTRLSEGRFDITSGVLRRAWTFDGGDRVPTQAQIDALLPLVGWDKVAMAATGAAGCRPACRSTSAASARNTPSMRPRALADALAPGLSCLVNFGGDVAARAMRAATGSPGASASRRSIGRIQPSRLVHLQRGALATSGDSRRFV